VQTGQAESVVLAAGDEMDAAVAGLGDDEVGVGESFFGADDETPDLQGFSCLNASYRGGGQTAIGPVK
jgi:hypothetical protein